MSKEDTEKLKVLQEGYHDQFWSLMSAELEQNIKNCEDEIKNFDGREMTAEKYKFEIEILKERKDIYKRLIELPNALAQELMPQGKIEDPDVYEKADKF